MQGQPSSVRTSWDGSPCRFIDPLEPNAGREWDAWVQSAANATVFHTSAWARVLADSYRYRPSYVVFQPAKGGRTLLPIFEVKSVITGTRGVSLPFTDYCEPLTEGEPGLREVPEEVKDFARSRGWKTIELRGVPGMNATASGSYYVHTLSLTSDEDALFAGMTGNTRRNVRKAKKEGVEISVSDAESALKKYYRLHCLTRKRQGVPPQPYIFFRNIHKHVIGEGNGFVVLAAKGGVEIAGAVYLHTDRRAMYKFGASDYRFQNLRANSLVMWEAIKRLAGNGVESFCFGRTDMPQDGLRRFKAGFGAEERVIHYHKFDLRTSAFVEPSSGGSERQERIFRAMPLPLLRLAGAMLYRHVG